MPTIFFNSLSVGGFMRYRFSSQSADLVVALSWDVSDTVCSDAMRLFSIQLETMAVAARFGLPLLAHRITTGWRGRFFAR